MADYPAVDVNTKTWKALPVPTEAVSVQCQKAPIFITVQSNRTNSYGLHLMPGQTVSLKSGQAAFVRQGRASVGLAVIEVIV